jgi:methyl-accepting chemotaxis protein
VDVDMLPTHDFLWELQSVHSIKISKLANIMGALVLMGFFAVVGLSYYTIEKLKVGGPYYVRMINGKDLIADILPPPLYIIEPFLEASHLIVEPTKLSQHRAHLTELRKAYDTQRKRWLDENVIDLATRDTVTQEAHRYAAQFWDTLETRLYPAIEKNDAKATKEAFDSLEVAYDAQRKAVDKAVEMATAMNEKITAEAAQEERWSMLLAIVIGIPVLLAVILSIAGVILGMVRPIKRMQEIMQTLASGDRQVEIPYIHRHDEIGGMAHSVQVFKDNLVETEKLRDAHEAAERRAADERQQHNIELADHFESAVGTIIHSVASASSELDVTAESLTHIAKDTTSQSQTVVSASNTASDNVRAVASAAEQLAGSIREISTQVNFSANMAHKAENEAQKTTAQMNALSSAAEHIGGIVELINQIASQTNLLALNASIEAARAGELGRGFVVVSQEVKQLAERTAKATGEIANQITSIQNFINEAAQSITEIASTIKGLNDISSTIASAVEEQGSVTQEIARNIHYASEGTNNVTCSIQSVRQSAENSNDAATQVLTAARDLAKQSNMLQIEMVQFLENIRAA